MEYLHLDFLVNRTTFTKRRSYRKLLYYRIGPLKVPSGQNGSVKTKDSDLISKSESFFDVKKNNIDKIRCCLRRTHKDFLCRIVHLLSETVLFSTVFLS